MCSAAGGSTQGYGSDKQTSFAGTMAQGMGGGAGGAGSTILGAAPALAANGTVLASYTPPRTGQGWRGGSNAGDLGPYTYQYAQRQKL